MENSLFANLFSIQPNGQLKAVLATEVPTLQNGGISKDGLTYTIHIKPNAVWSNGKPITSQDVVTTWKLITNPQVTALTTAGWKQIKDIKIVSPKEFQVILSRPFAPLLYDCFGGIPTIVPSSVFKGMGATAVDKAEYNHDPTVTDGPFMFKSWVPGASITVVDNPHWIGPQPKVKEIVFKIVPNDNTLLAQAQAHAINVYSFGAVEQVPQLKAIKGATVHFTNGPYWESAFVNLKNPVLQPLQMREALMMAINRDAIIQKVWKGHASKINANQPPGSWAYDPNIQRWPYNPTKSKKLIKSLGYTMGSNGYFEKNGKTLSLTYSTTAENPWRAATERLVQYWFKQVGVKLNIKNYPSNAYFGTVLPSKKGWDLGEAEYYDTTPDPAAAIETQWECGAAENWSSFCDKALDTAMKTQDGLITQQQRQPYLWKAEQILHSQLPNLWYYGVQSIATSIDMTGYEPNPFTNDTWNCYDWAPTKG